MNRPLFLALALLASWRFAAPAHAALDPEAKQPYQLQVVLHVADHRLLTPLFKDRVERELGDALQGAYGDLAKVAVVRAHPRLKEVEEKGLQALDGWKDVTGVKTHFVFLDFADGQYVLQARQHDGLTGQASPVVREDRTADRQLVARTAALLVGRDFGVVGTVAGKDTGDLVRLAMKAGKLGAPPDGWVRKGDVFALVQMSRGGGGLRAYRVPWAILQAEREADNGDWWCRLFHRHPNPLAEGPGVVGYRCLKIATVRAPLHVRVVRANAPKPTPEPGLRLHVQREGFRDDEPGIVQGVTDADGFLRTDKLTDRPFDGVAFVRVLGGDGKERARIPVALVDDRTVVVSVAVGPEAAGLLTVRRDLWLERLYDALREQAELFKELRELVGDAKKREAVLAKAEEGLKGVETDLDHFGRTRDLLRNDGAAKADLAEGEQRLQELRKGREELRGFVDRQKQILAQEKDPKWKELQDKVQQAHLAEGDADFGKALALYEEVVAGGVDDAALREHLARLKKAWEVKDAKHAEARRFVYEDWPAFDPGQMKAKTERARQAFAACRAAGDRLTPQKLLKVAVAHVGELKKLAADLRPDENEDDRKRAQDIAAVTEGLAPLIKEVAAYLEEGAGKK